MRSPLAGVLLALLLALPGGAWAEDERRLAVPVAVYVNVDELSVLWPFRDPKTGAFPERGEEGFEAYEKVWNGVIAQAVNELRRRVPKDFLLLPARSPEQPYAIKIDLWIADLATDCGAPTFYKYLWVRTRQRDERYTTNWDGLGVQSETLVDVGMPPTALHKAEMDAWVELWAQVPYLHVLPGGQPEGGDGPAEEGET